MDAFHREPHICSLDFRRAPGNAGRRRTFAAFDTIDIIDRIFDVITVMSRAIFFFYLILTKSPFFVKTVRF